MTQEEKNIHQMKDEELQNEILRLQEKFMDSVQKMGLSWNDALLRHFTHKAPLDIALAVQKAREDRKSFEIAEQNARSVKFATWVTVIVFTLQLIIAIFELVSKK